jgi:cysteine desulfurase / selenocysteine lyase
MDKRSLRSLFPVSRNCVYLNHAAVGPLPTSSCEAMGRIAADQRDWGAVHWRDWLEVYVRFRDAAARLIGATPGEISILKNTSEGVAFVAEGLDWKAGENVVTTDMEFPSNFVPWKRLERKGVECRLVRNRGGAFAPGDVEAAIDGRTRVVALSAVSFHNGFRPDLEAIGAICQARGVMLFVDAIQALGALDFDVRRAKVSFLAADGHKWMLGPEGAAIFYAADDVRDRLDPLESGWLSIAGAGTKISETFALRDDGRRFEAGSINTVGVAGLTASIELLLGLGIGEVEREIVRLATKLGDALDGFGFRVASPKPLRSGIIGIALPDRLDLEKARGELVGVGKEAPPGLAGLSLVHLWLEHHGVICSPREGMLRFSPHVWNDDAEVDRVVELLGSLL